MAFWLPFRQADWCNQIHNFFFFCLFADLGLKLGALHMLNKELIIFLASKSAFLPNVHVIQIHGC